MHNYDTAPPSLETKQKAIAGVREYYPELAEAFEQKVMNSNDLPIGVLKDLVIDRDKDARAWAGIKNGPQPSPR